MADTIISLTTIPTRFDHIDAALGNLVNQTADIAEIRLYIPRRYRRFPEMEISQPKVRKGVRVCMVDDDFGPATKILPAVSDFAGQDVNILFCDDDQQASPDFARRFLDARAEHPNYCIVERGYELSDRPVGSPYYPKHTYFPRVGKRRKDLAYRLKRAASLLQYKLPPFSKSGFVDVLEGFGGVLVKPDFFPPEVFDIPDIL